MLNTLFNLISLFLAGVTPAAEAGEPKPGVILFVGDGMGVSTARILDGQNRGRPGDENPDLDYRQRATHPMLAETLAAEDVPAYATGAEGVGGITDQHELHAVMHVALFGQP